MRPLSEAEKEALPLLARGSALRFMLTRLYDWLTIPDGALVQKRDPIEYIRRLRFHRAVKSASGVWPEMKTVEIFTDGACSGNPGPGGWGAILRFNGDTKELSGGEADTTNNRMELMAAISALNALKEPCEVDFIPTANTSWTASPAGSKAGSATAGKPPTRSR